MKKRSIMTAALALGLSLATTMPVGAQSIAGQPVDLTVAAEKAVNAVVYIKVTINSKKQTVPYRDPFADFFGDFFGHGGSGYQERQIQTPKRQGAGSGVILSEDGYIVTNNHVVAEADELLVKLNDNSEYKGRIIGTDEKTDLALIKIEAEKLTPIVMGSSDALKVGEWVLAVGNPYSLTSTVTAGIVSAKARGIGATPNSIESFIQTDAAINPGNSGGALVNVKGELVGVNAMLYSQTGSFSGYGFAIPTSIVENVVADLKKYGTVQRAVLGISGQDVSTYLEMRREKEGKEIDLGTVNGVYVAEVSSDGSVADVLREGDVITQLDGHKVNKMSEVQERLAHFKPGQKISITYIRDKKEHTANVTLRNVQGTTSAIESVDGDALGAALRPLTDKEKRELALRHGLVVTAVRSGKMQEAGVTKGIIIMQVNDREMKTLEDFNAAVKEANMSAERQLWIRAKTQSGINKSFVIELSDSSKQGGK